MMNVLRFSCRALSTCLLLGVLLSAHAMAADPALKKADSSLSPWLPTGFPVVIVIRPSEIAAQKSLAPVLDLFVEGFEQKVGVRFSDVETLTIAHNPLSGEMTSLGPFGLILHSSKPLKLAARLEQQRAVPTEVELGSRKYLIQHSMREDWFSPDDKTMVIGGKRFIADAIKTQGIAKSPLAANPSWNAVSRGHLALSVDAALLKQMIPGFVQTELAHRLEGVISPLLNDVNRVFVGVRLGEKTGLIAYVEATDADAARKVQATIAALVTLAQNSSEFYGNELRHPVAAPVAKIATQLTGSATVDSVDKTTVRLRANAQVNAELVGKVAKSIEKARNGRSVDNLRKIGLAMLNHHANHGAVLPGSAVAKKGHPVSWRVRILPFVDQAPLYKQYRLDEPWDSENNKQVLAMMPQIYRHPSDDPTSTNSSYFMITGKEAHPADKDIKLADIPDGLPNTILIVEAKRAVPWTKPEDIEIAAGEPLPQFGGWDELGFGVVFANGSVQTINNNVDEKVLRPFFTRAGGEQVDVNALGRP